jgi:hypothetical protein
MATARNSFSLGSEGFDQRGEHVSTRGVVTLARIASHKARLPAVIDGASKRIEFAALVEHLLRKRQGEIEEAVEVVLGHVGRRFTPRHACHPCLAVVSGRPTGTTGRRSPQRRLVAWHRTAEPTAYLDPERYRLPVT